jgi:hypothetical protein
MTGRELKEHVQPQLIELGDRSVSTHGFQSDLFLKHLESHLLQPKEKWQWCDIPCATRTVSGGRATPMAKKQMRQRIARLFLFLLNRGKFLLVIYGGPRRQITEVKLFDPAGASQADREFAYYQLERMKKRGDIQASTYNRALGMVNAI